MNELMPVFLLENNVTESQHERENYIEKSCDQFFEASEVSDLDDSEPEQSP